MAVLMGVGAGAVGAAGIAQGKVSVRASLRQADKAPTLVQARRARGTVRMCGDLPPELTRGFNQKYRARGVKLRIVELQPGDPHDELLRLQRSRSRRCDLFGLDVVWTAEFASTGALLDVTPIIRARRAEFLRSPLSTARYSGRYFAVPQSTNAGLLYYRTDRIASVPDTWQGVYESARANGGIVYQGAAYEGLTVDFLELAFAAGGTVLSRDGRKSVINSPENVQALRFMADGIRTGAAPSAVTVFDEYGTFSGFFAGGPAYMRNWTYAYAEGQQTSLAGKFGVVALPPFAGGGRSAVLGGSNLVISAYGPNRRGAVLAIDYLTSPAAQELGATQFGAAPVLRASYDDPDIKKAWPFAAELREGIESAKTRPVSANYLQLSAAIYTNINAALRGDVTPEAALRMADRQINEMLRGPERQSVRARARTAS